jgi:hypothetical protein
VGLGRAGSGYSTCAGDVGMRQLLSTSVEMLTHCLPKLSTNLYNSMCLENEGPMLWCLAIFR